MKQKSIGIGYFEEIKTVFSLTEESLEKEYPNVRETLQNADYTMYQRIAPYLFYYFLPRQDNLVYPLTASEKHFELVKETLNAKGEETTWS
ncbi:hypothetical protein SCODD09_00949 [Streptococcus constellatus]|nr:hypothetical protein SCODD09_00949 [Streptococcus constellatus]